jgi:hypothetical protein
VREAAPRKIAARSAAAAALLGLCLGLAACGGSSKTESAATTSTSAVQGGTTGGEGATTARQKARPNGVAAKRHRAGSSGHRGAIPAKLREEAGRAAPFLVSGGDNSVPVYGSEGLSAQKAEATKALAGYLIAREEGNWARACSLMGASVRGQVRVLAEASGAKRPHGCVQSYGSLAKNNPPRERKNVLVGSLAAFRVKGDKAFALFYGPHRQQFMMPMVREAGRWKVSQSIPIAYPIGAPVRGG